MANIGKRKHNLRTAKSRTNFIVLKWQRLAKIGKDWQRLAKIGKDWQRLAKIGKDWQNVGQANCGKKWHKIYIGIQWQILA